MKKGRSGFKGKKHSEETRRRMSESRKGPKHSFYGKHHSEEARRKIRLARAKQVHTDESNRKRSETQKGRTFSKESLQKMSDHAKKRFANKKNHPSYGKTPSKDTRKKMSIALKGRSYEDLHDIETALRLRNLVKEQRKNQTFPVKDTKIELKIQSFLKQLGIEFVTHQYMRIRNAYQCDILIPSMNLVIECDGDYWHGNLEVYDNWNNLNQKQKVQKIIDYERTNELEEKGYKVWRLWESDINKMGVPQFENELKNK